MNLKQKLFISIIVTFGSLVLGLTATASAAPRLLKGNHRKVCDVTSLVGVPSCFAQVVDDSAGNPAASTVPAGYGPTQFHTAYQLPTTATNPGTIGVVDAYDDPNITADLANYDKTFSLPVFPACTTTVKTSCFQKVNQQGTTTYPARSSSWALETSLDVETAHEICQNCKVILVEASSASYTNLMTAIDRARLLSAAVISNSYGSGEFNSEHNYDTYFNHPGVAFIFSAGDAGYGATYPASSPLVLAAGGTSLTLSATNAWQSESVWSGSNSGCSTYEAKPSYQKDISCKNRTMNDLAADADPNTGAAIYDSYAFGGVKGWFQVGGTSLATPILAAAYALANNVGPASFANALPYSNFNYATNLHDITAGTNGNCSTYLCKGATGYDGPTGLGSPNGLGAF